MGSRNSGTWMRAVEWVRVGLGVYDEVYRYGVFWVLVKVRSRMTMSEWTSMSMSEWMYVDRHVYVSVKVVGIHTLGIFM